jgi:2'-5' RNA ligase
MSESIRAFFGVAVPAAVRETALKVRNQLESRSELRWVPEENLHLTLKFLGDLERRELPKLIARAAGRLAQQEPFDARIGGIGAFQTLREADVLWLGITRGSAELAKLARKLDAAGRGVGAARDRQPFRAHLTLARCRPPQSFELSDLPEADSQSFCVDEVVLYESRLSSSGSTYLPLTHLPLGAGQDTNIELAPEL